MAKYGAMMNLPNGNPFITPDSTPFCLYSRQVVTSSVGNVFQEATASIEIDPSYPLIAFGKASGVDRGGYPMFCGRLGDRASVTCRANFRNVHPFTLTAYFFAIFPQPLPKYGMAIWDAQSKLVLTNESKVLSDLVTIGTVGNQGGINIDQTIGGSYAVSPTVLGATVPMAMRIMTACVFNGSATRFYGAAASEQSQPPMGFINHGISITAINTAAYD